MTVVADEPTKLEETVKSLLKKNAISMRKLAVLTGIDAASISRMISGKQRLNTLYLQRIAENLNVPTQVLFSAAGIDVGETPQQKSQDVFLEILSEILEHPDFHGHHFTRREVELELAKYEDYARTDEGVKLILEKFSEKRQQVIGSGPFVQYLDQLYHAFLLEAKPEEKSVLGGGLLYFILSTDQIPDYIFPIGFLDDALAVQIAWTRFTQMK